MPQLDKMKPGDVISAKYLNTIRSEVKSNRIVGTSGLNFKRGKGGTVLSVQPISLTGFFFGREAVGLNLSGRDYSQFTFVGVEEVTGRDDFGDMSHKGVDYIIRNPEPQDLPDKLVNWFIPQHAGGASCIRAGSCE